MSDVKVLFFSMLTMSVDPVFAQQTVKKHIYIIYSNVKAVISMKKYI